MPQNKKQEFVFTILMVIIMVYGMVCYNISLDQRKMENWIFLAALSELPIMGVIAVICEALLVGPLAQKYTFKMFDPSKTNPIFIILSISIMTVWMMCPLMSFAATLLFKGGFNSELIATWVQITVTNFPMAFFLQIFFAGPVLRKLHKLFISKL